VEKPTHSDSCSTGWTADSLVVICHGDQSPMAPELAQPTVEQPPRSP